jgi:hypothetical protein
VPILCQSLLRPAATDELGGSAEELLVVQAIAGRPTPEGFRSGFLRFRHRFRPPACRGLAQSEIV